MCMKRSCSDDIIDGFRIGIPIALGYFAVAFSLGIIAKQAGLTAVIGFVSSFFTRASAGEYGVYTLVAAQASHGSLSRRYHLLRHRLSDGYADTLILCDDEYNKVLSAVG